MATTKPKTIRISNQLWDKALKRARDEGTTLAEVIRVWLEDYVNDNRTVTDEMNSVMERLRRIRTRLSLDTLSELNGETE